MSIISSAWGCLRFQNVGIAYIRVDVRWVYTRILLQECSSLFEFVLQFFVFFATFIRCWMSKLVAQHTKELITFIYTHVSNGTFPDLVRLVALYTSGLPVTVGCAMEKALAVPALLDFGFSQSFPMYTAVQNTTDSFKLASVAIRC